MYSLEDFIHGSPSVEARDRFKAHVTTVFPWKTPSCFCCRPSTFYVPEAIDKLEELKTWGVPGLSYALSTDQERPDRIRVTIDAFRPSRPIGRQALQSIDMSAEAMALMPLLELLMTLAVKAGGAESWASVTDRCERGVADLAKTWAAELELERVARAKAEARAAGLEETNARLDAELHHYREAERAAAIERRRLEREAAAEAAEARARTGRYMFPEAGDGGFPLGDIIDAFQQAIEEVGEPDVRWTKDGVHRVRLHNKALAGALYKRGVGQRVMRAKSRNGYRVYFYKPMVDQALTLLRTERG